MSTKIEWTDETWNPITGCTPISEGCQNCYAKRMANRLRGRYGYPNIDPFRVTMHHDRLHHPGDWKKPKLIFVCSMGDIFHDHVEWNWLFSIFQIAALLKRHKFLFLTKRLKNAYKFLAGDGGFHLQRQGLGDWPFKNIWIGATVENQYRADERIPILLQIPAAVRFVSVEPMLGPIDLSRYLYEWLNGLPATKIVQPSLNWVICGSETGPGARIMKDEWAIDLYAQCKAAGVPFFFKKPSKHSNLVLPRQYPK